MEISNEVLNNIADRYAKKAAKTQMRKISKIFYKSVKDAFKEGWIAREGAETPKTYCDICELWKTEYRCRECKKNEFI